MSNTPIITKVTLLRQQLTEDEGRRLKPYTDPRGYISIGVGRNLTINGITEAMCDAMLTEDVSIACNDVQTEWQWSVGLPDAQWAVLVNLCFNMGLTTLRGFGHFLAAMEQHDWTTAALELQNSDWWNEVGERGPRMVARLTGG